MYEYTRLIRIRISNLIFEKRMNVTEFRKRGNNNIGDELKLRLNKTALSKQSVFWPPVMETLQIRTVHVT
jgi:siroheme synthase (precorrin-2 oxidase/ferrochelatase)